MKSYSYSKIRLWEECELKFCAHELLGLKPDSLFDFDPKMQLGSLIHNYFEKFYKSQIQTSLFRQGVISLPEWQEKFRQEWNKLSQKLFIPSKDVQKALEERGLVSLKNFYEREKQKDFKLPIYLEGRFQVDLGQFKLGGRIDRVDREEDGSLTVIDYKISDQVQTCLQADADQQLTLYYLACKQSLSREAPKRLALYYPIQDEIVYTTRTDEDVHELLEKILNMDLEILERGCNSDKYNTSPAEWKCRSCGFKEQCPEHKFMHDLSLPNKADIESKVEEFLSLKKQIAPLEESLEGLKSEIKEYMKDNQLKKIGACSLKPIQGDIYDPIKSWDLIRKLEDGYQYVKSLNKSLIDEHWDNFEPEQKDILKAAKIRKPVVYHLRVDN